MSTKKNISKALNKKQGASTNNKKIRLAKDRAEIAQLKIQCAESINSGEIKNFLDFPISKRTFLGLKDAGYKIPTDIQREAIPLALKGLDILGAAKTGSGKTLSFLIPILEHLYKSEWTPIHGLGALVISPVRELAYQIFETLKKIGKLHEFSASLLIGGSNLYNERSRLKNCNIIITTPGRLLQHMDENPLFDCCNLQMLVLDEADKILELGFSSTMNAIIENLPHQRQTLLFSATQTRSVKDLVRLSLKDPVFVSVNERAKQCTPDTLEESYIVCELHEKLTLLWSFIKKHPTHKIIVFMMSCKQVKFTYEAFIRLRPSITVMALYGTLHQLRRMAIYDAFCKERSAVLLATDIAARGLDFPNVDWVVQLDCPENVTTYIHRAGRTARCEARGESILVLLPSEETAMISQLKEKRIPINKIAVAPSQLQSIQLKLEMLLAQNVKLKESAQRAFVNYIKSVFLMKDKKIFDVHKLNIEAYARSLGLASAPRLRFLQKSAKFAEQQKSNKVHATSENVGTSKLSSDTVNKVEDTFSSINNVENTESKDHVEENMQNNLTPIVYPDDENDEFLTVRRKIVPADSEEDADMIDVKSDELTPLNKGVGKLKKPPTRASIAKKIRRQKLQLNEKLYFNEDGEVIVDVNKKRQTEVAENKYYDAGGINIEAAIEIMKQEDEIDKKLYQQRVKAIHKEKRLKKKRSLKKNQSQDEIDEDDRSSSDETASVDLSFLPDPDKVYGTASKDTESNSDAQSDDSYDSEESSADKTELKNLRKRKLERTKFTKRRRTNMSSDEDSNIKDTGLSLRDDEELALRLLAA